MNSVAHTPQFRVVPKDELLSGTLFSVSFTTLTVNATKHIVYLHKLLRAQ